MDERVDKYLADERARREYCARLISACFESAKESLGELDAWMMFVQFAKAALPDPTITARNKDFDEQVLAAYEAAQDGAREQAAMEIGRRWRKPSDVALRRLARILCRRAAAASSADQLRLAFGLDPLERVKQAHDQFIQLSQDSQPDISDRPTADFSKILSGDAIGIPSPPDFAQPSGAPSGTDRPRELSPEDQLVEPEAESEPGAAQVVELPPIALGEERRARRRGRNGAR